MLLPALIPLPLSRFFRIEAQVEANVSVLLLLASVTSEVCKTWAGMDSVPNTLCRRAAICSRQGARLPMVGCKRSTAWVVAEIETHVRSSSPKQKVVGARYEVAVKLHMGITILTSIHKSHRCY